MIIEYNWLARDTQAICATQTLTFPNPGAASQTLALNGTEAAYGSNGVPYFVYNKVWRSISITSGANLSAITFIVVGTYKGEIQTISLIGPNATTIDTANAPLLTGTQRIFDSIISVAVSVVGPTVVTVSIGSGIFGYTLPYLMNNLQITNFYTYTGTPISGLVQYGCYGTLEDLMVDEPITPVLPIEELIAKTGVRTVGSQQIPFRYVYFKFNEDLVPANTGAVKFTILILSSQVR